MFSKIHRTGLVMALAFILATGSGQLFADDVAANEADAPGKSEKDQSTADHSKFKELQVDFKAGPEVT